MSEADFAILTRLSPPCSSAMHSHNEKNLCVQAATLARALIFDVVWLFDFAKLGCDRSVCEVPPACEDGDNLDRYKVNKAHNHSAKPEGSSASLIIADHFHEAIGLGLDLKKRCIFVWAP